MKFKTLVATALIVLSSACAKDADQSKSLTESDTYFKDMKGCFLLFNIKTQKFDKVVGEATCRERFPACSTFKVPLAVMAFDSGILKDENVVLKWDGVKDSRPEVNRDHNAKTWMRDSVVWFSQRITPKLGKKKFQKYLTDFKYGNEDISSGITTAWLDSPAGETGLKISAYEQVDFMLKLWSDGLPVSKRSMELTRKITYLETSPKGYKLNGKTGSGFYNREKNVNFGWFTSHLQLDEQEYIVVTNLSDLKPYPTFSYGGPRAKQIAKDILTAEGLW